MKYDRDFKVAYVTTNFRDDNNVSTEGFIGKTSRELGIPNEICDIWENAIEKVFKTGKNQNIEFEFPSADGNYPKVFYINFIPESDGKTVKYVLGVSTEITELKNAQNELKEIQDNLEQKVEDRTKEIRMAYESLEHEMNKGYKMEERLLYQANLLENVNDAVIAIDTEFNITSWNKAAKKIYGWDFEEVSGKDSIHLLRINPSNEDKEEIIHSIAEEGIFNREIIHRKKDGTSVYVGSTVMELKDINDEIIGYIALNRDISKRKKVQEELKETIENLKRSNEELERFAYVASHDLQEPLRTIASFTQLLEKRYKGKFDSDADEFMDYIVEAAKRMKEQIVGLLEFSRVATNGEEFQPISTNSILDHVTSNLKASIKECNGEITRDNLPDITGDAAQLQRVFQNLISNAIKFRKPGEPPKIHVSSVKDDEKGDYIFKVSDNGIGIEEQYFDRIFTIFQRLHTREKYKGTGIGLSIVKKIIDRHGGRVWVESSFGVGSTFYFTIPNL
jgi:PAS domain S-box-containing protein